MNILLTQADILLGREVVKCNVYLVQQAIK